MTFNRALKPGSSQAADGGFWLKSSRGIPTFIESQPAETSAGTRGVGLVWHYEGYGGLACLQPRASAVVTNGAGTVTRLGRCGSCASCVEAQVRRKAKAVQRKVQRELERANTTYWGTLTFDEFKTDDEINSVVREVMREFFKKLRLGRVRVRPTKKDKLGRTITDKFGYPIYLDPLPPVNTRRLSREQRTELGFITGDPDLRYSWVLEKGAKGRWHIHLLLHVFNVSGLPPGAIPEAWPHGFSKVKVTGSRPKDRAKLSRYLAKYLVKQKGLVIGPDFQRSKYLRASPNYGLGDTSDD